MSDAHVFADLLARLLPKEKAYGGERNARGRKTNQSSKPARLCVTPDLEHGPAGGDDAERQSVGIQQLAERTSTLPAQPRGARNHRADVAEALDIQTERIAIGDQVERTAARRVEAQVALRLNRQGDVRPRRRHGRGS